MRRSEWPVGKSSPRYVGRLTAPDVAARMSARSVLCLPIGSYEQHGPHLPLETDTILADRYAFGIVARWGERYDVWSLPTIPFGLSREHGWSPGTLSLPVQTFTGLVLSLCEELVASLPARHLLIVNGHGGNRGILEALVYEIERSAGLNVCVTHPSALSGVRSGSPLPEIHAGLSETSVMLAFAPDVVHMDRLPASYAPEPSLAEGIRSIVLHRGTTWPWKSNEPAISTLGIMGDARNADAELGRRIIESALDEYGNVLAALLARGGINGPD